MKTNNKHFWEFRNAAENTDEAELILYGDISSESWWGDEVTPKTFSDELKALGDIKSLNIRINSGGGDVFAAFGIYNRIADLRKKGTKVKCTIDGWAASAATVICMAADSIAIPAVAAFMIHDPKVGTHGYYKAEELEKISAELKVIKNSIVAAYAGKTGKSSEEISKAMSEETWFDGAEAVNAGYCDELIETSASVENRGGHVFVNSVEMKDIPEKVLNRFCGSHNSGAAMAAGGVPGNGDRLPGCGKDGKEGETSMEIKTAAELKAQYPELCKEIENSAAKAERERIKNIEENAVSGFEDIMEDAKFKNPISAEQAAVKVLAAIKKQGGEYLNNRAEDAQNSGISGNDSTPAPEKDESGDREFNDALKAVFGDKK